jgi:hypothetical protein
MLLSFQISLPRKAKKSEITAIVSSKEMVDFAKDTNGYI